MEKKNKKTYRLVILLVALLLGVSGVIIFLIIQTSRLQQNPVNPGEDLQVINQASPLDITMTENTFSEDLMVEIRGQLIDELYYRNDVLMGDFIINGDSNQRPFHLLLGVKSGEVIFAQRDSKETVFENVPTNEVYEKSLGERNMFIRLAISQLTDVTDEHKKSQQQYSEPLQLMLKEGTLSIPEEFTFIPVVFGVTRSETD